MVEALEGGRRFLWCGNGGSAAEAQHMGRTLGPIYLRERRATRRSVSSTARPLTCVGNDYGTTTCSRDQVRRSPTGDVVVGLTTSGTSRTSCTLCRPRRRRAVAIAFTVRAAAGRGRCRFGPARSRGYARSFRRFHQVMAQLVCDWSNNASSWEINEDATSLDARSTSAHAREARHG